MDTATDRPDTNPSPDSGKWTGYSSCERLPLSIFIDCLLNGVADYHKLTISGDASIEQLTAVWVQIYSEYHEIIGSNAMHALIIQIWERDQLSTKIYCIRGLIKALSIRYNTDVAECLAMFGYTLPPDPTPQQIENLLRMLQGRLKGDEAQLRELDSVLQSLKTGVNARQDFMKQLMDVGKYEGYRLRIEELTVLEYCIYIKRYSEYCELENKKNHVPED